MHRKQQRRFLAGRVLAAAGMTVAAGAVVVTVFAQSASGWDLSFRAISGGGGSSSLGTTKVEGSIGQPLVGRSTGGNFAAASGIFEGGGTVKYIRRLPIIATDGAP